MVHGQSQRRCPRPAAAAGALAALLLGLAVRMTAASESDMPASIQAQLLSKVPAYDYEFRRRAGALVRVLILSRPEHSESVRAATLLQAALVREKGIASLPHEALIAPFSGVDALAQTVRERSVSIVYLTPGLEELESICRVLEPLHVLTVTTQADYVRRCAVLGLQVVAGRPRLAIHLAHAQRSGIRFRAELLQLATVYR
jgi:hypothetical protein